jgi:hypothetical protein
MSPFLSEFTDWLKTESFQFSISDSFIFIENRDLAFHLVPLDFFENEVGTNSIRPPLPSGGRILFFPTLPFSEKKQRLIHLHEDVWRTQSNLVKSRILSLLGRFKKINGRHCFVERIDKKKSANFLNNNHLQNSVKAKFQYGLFLKSQYIEKFLGIKSSQNPENILVAVATFSGGRAMKFGKRAGQRSYELLRFASLAGYVVVGGLDKLLQAFTKEHLPDDIMTYADADWSDGRSYKVLGFEEIGIISPQEFWVNPVTFERISGGNMGENKPVFLKTHNSGSIKFIKFLTKNNV